MSVIWKNKDNSWEFLLAIKIASPSIIKYTSKYFIKFIYESNQWATEVPVLNDLFVYLQEESCTPMVLNSNVTIEARVQWMLSEKPHMGAL